MPADVPPELLEELRAFARALEPPECDCPVEPACTLRGRAGCKRRRETGDCDCVYVPGPACPHATLYDWREETFSFADWAELLAQAWPRVYLDPPKPFAAETCPLTHADRINLLAARAGPKYHGEAWGAEARALRHPGDVDQLEREDEHYSRRTTRDGTEFIIETKGADHDGGGAAAQRGGGEAAGPAGGAHKAGPLRLGEDDAGAA